MDNDVSSDDKTQILEEVVGETLKLASALGALTGGDGGVTTGLVANKAGERLGNFYQEFGEAEVNRVEAVIKMCDLVVHLQEFFPKVRWPQDIRYWEGRREELRLLKQQIMDTISIRVKELRAG